MFEAKLVDASLWKKIIESLKDLVQEATLDCSEQGISMQAMDSSHVSLISMVLKCDGFETYRCDRNISLGLNIASVAKILRCAGPNDSLCLKAEDDGDTLSFVFESPNQEKVSEFDIKLMLLDADHLGIPDTEYKCVIRMPSGEFSRVCRDLIQIGDSVTISVAGKDAVVFSSNGDLGQGKIKLAQTSSEKPEECVSIEMTESVCMTYSLRYFNIFAKAAPLSSSLCISLTENVPAVLEFAVEDFGHLRFYLAPKIEDEEE